MKLAITHMCVRVLSSLPISRIGRVIIIVGSINVHHMDPCFSWCDITSIVAIEIDACTSVISPASSKHLRCIVYIMLSVVISISCAEHPAFVNVSEYVSCYPIRRLRIP